MIGLADPKPLGKPAARNSPCPAPSAVWMFLIIRACEPWFVIVAKLVKVTPGPPIAAPPALLLGATTTMLDAGLSPKPVSLYCDNALGSSHWIWSVAAAGPATSGSKVTCNGWLWPGERIVPGARAEMVKLPSELDNCTLARVRSL